MPGRCPRAPARCPAACAPPAPAYYPPAYHAPAVAPAALVGVAAVPVAVAPYAVAPLALAPLATRGSAECPAHRPCAAPACEPCAFYPYVCALNGRPRHEWCLSCTHRRLFPDTPCRL
jgi:hypothetical protein